MADREKLIELVGQVQDCGCDVTDVVEMNYVENSVLVDHLISEGVTVRERGRWIQDTPFACVCSVCNHERYGLANDSGDNFCPNCGADMRGDEDGNET